MRLVLPTQNSNLPIRIMQDAYDSSIMRSLLQMSILLLTIRCWRL